MAIGEKIHFFRLLQGMIQKYLGMTLAYRKSSLMCRRTRMSPGCTKCSAPGSRQQPCWRRRKNSQEDYNKWRYYPEYDSSQSRAKMPPEDLT